jgi:hypothetical protein
MPPASSTHVHQLSDALLSELENTDAKKLKFAKCPSCKKMNCYRLASLKDSPLTCKSCNTTIPIERHGKPQRNTTEEDVFHEEDI